jgi:DNA polymerase-3 subunit epsilon
MNPTVVAVAFVAVLLILALVGVALLNRSPGDQDSSSGSLGLSSPAAPAKPPQPAPTTQRELSALLPAQFVVLDLETTGLNPLTDEIIEIGAVKATLNSENHSTFQLLVKPSRCIPRKISQITGITQEMVDRDGVHLHEALTEFVDFIGDLPLVTFNAEFDMGFLCSAANREKIVIRNCYACALKRARRAWPGLQSYRLADLARMGNLSTVDAHRALGDSIRALIVFTAATSKLGQKVRWIRPTVN